VFAGLATKINELQRLLANGGTVQRGFHAKVHGCMKAEFRIDANRPAATRYGLFATDGTKQAWVRLSNGQGKAGPDNDRDVRGLAIKVLGVDGERLLGDDATTQDFLMTNRAASHVNDAIEFMDFAEQAAKGNLIGWGLLHPVAAARLFRQTAPVTTLVTRFWSGSPYRLGPSVAKFAVWPCYGQPTGTQGAIADDADFLRHDLEARITTGDVCYQFGVQIRKDPANESVEKASAVWDEQRNPFVPVAQLVLKQRTLEAEHADEDYCNDFSFNPWNGLVEHQPLGHMNRARKPVYMSSAALRGHLPQPKPE
jgi:catalase